MKPLVAAFAAVTLLTVSAQALADDLPPPPPRYPPSSIRAPLIASGIGIAGGAYALGALSSRLSPEIPGADAIMVPVVGPWVALGQNACSPLDLNCGGLLYVRGVLLALDGITQIAGLAMVAEGIFMKTEHGGGERDASVLEFRRGDLTIQPFPITSKNMAGLGITGSF